MANTAQDSAILYAIMEAAVDAMIISDQAGIILRANAAAAQMFKFDVTDMVGHNVSMLMPAALAVLHDGFISHHIETGEKRIIGLGRDVEGQRKDGSVFPLHLSVGHAQIDQQRFFIGILHDLTDRKATEDALARSQRLDAIGQMTGGIAHDFNNLLTVITGNLELLEMRGADDRQLPLIRDALESAELGADLTTRLMVFARRSNLKPVLSDLRTLCSETLTLLNRTFGATYRIKTDFAVEADLVMIDPVQLQSALMNLAFNARDAMQSGGELLVSIANVTIDDNYMAQETDIAPGDYVRISVSDNGAGMSLEAQRRAFEPFFSTKQDSGGTGLGLAMVYGFVRQSGGHVTLYSELGLGTSFGLYFPAVEQGKTLADPAANKESVTAPTFGNGKTVMIVEDNPMVRKLSIERIRDLGFATLEAESGDQAYEMLSEGAHVDLVFSDLVMPGELNGYDLAGRIEAEFPTLKVLLTSGYANDVLASTIAQERHFDILHKPYRQSELAARLQALLTDTSDP
ncbi:Sensor histidine kinase/response regulator [Sulfitobacter noctilucicola]|uniref:Sensor protein FixL n=1 Tax=Sulfitobacter noctilucicola TaxID=1342301 RepID=A0A7W6M5K9_9RHOB|nr:PAS domain S-box protein [Sulfitobacter noctilucicola]KIN62681.1 Sensor histidine kinase/response regulator [Sulfitobacter noctilucicola]MBB4172786.1 PAS domain S-box-containing protein [Sulfitobacter noctilucicola]